MKNQSHQPLVGLNLGGWLVVEKWMTPNLFKGLTAANEYELSQDAEGRQRLQAHRRSFITEADFKWMAKEGIEIIRLPFGHGVFGHAKHYIGAIDQIDWAIKMANKYHIKVLLDMHAAPGAQNEFQHSGSGQRRKGNKWLKNKVHQNQTINILELIAKRYRHEPCVWGIQLLNEPSLGFLGLRLAWLYRRAYRALVNVARPGTCIIFSDAYAPPLLTNTFWLMAQRDFPVVMDSHFYQCFGARTKHRSFERQLAIAKARSKWIRLLSWQQPIIVGEWSAVLPIPTDAQATNDYVIAQLQGFKHAEAVFYWNYKTEGPGRWNYREQRETGRIKACLEQA